MLRGAAAALGGQAEAPAEPANGAAANGQALDLAELLGDVAVIQVAIRGLDQLAQALPVFNVHGARRGAPAQAMDEAADPRLTITGLEPPKLPEGHPEGLGALGIGDSTSEGRLDQASPRGLLPTHRDGLPCLHGRTFLQNS